MFFNAFAAKKEPTDCAIGFAESPKLATLVGTRTKDREPVLREAAPRDDVVAACALPAAVGIDSPAGTTVPFDFAFGL